MCPISKKVTEYGVTKRPQRIQTFRGEFISIENVTESSSHLKRKLGKFCNRAEMLPEKLFQVRKEFDHERANVSTLRDRRWLVQDLRDGAIEAFW